MPKLAEVQLSPGWLKNDVRRAQAQLDEWSGRGARTGSLPTQTSEGTSVSQVGEDRNPPAMESKTPAKPCSREILEQLPRIGVFKCAGRRDILTGQRGSLIRRRSTAEAACELPQLCVSSLLDRLDGRSRPRLTSSRSAAHNSGPPFRQPVRPSPPIRPNSRRRSPRSSATSSLPVPARG